MSDKATRAGPKAQAKTESKTARTDEQRPAKLGRKDYEKSSRACMRSSSTGQHLVVLRTGARICIVFEGRDGAGKGGTIRQSQNV